MNKTELIAAAISQLEQQLDTLVQSAESARASATHEDARPENQYDTRAVEASYLAGAQAARADQIRAEIGQLRSVPLHAWNSAEPIGPGALVELEDDGGRRARYLLAPGRGMTLGAGAKSVTLVTPISPLGRELLGKKLDDEFEVEVRGAPRGYTVTQIV